VSLACPVFSAIERSTRSLSQRATDEIENEKRLGLVSIIHQERRVIALRIEQGAPVCSLTRVALVLALASLGQALYLYRSRL